jgi:hypothetical protein
MRAFRRPSIAVLVLLNLWPALAFGQQVRPAGVVSTLQGTVRATRTTVPQPLDLKFKDEVFYQDRITTGDQSVARILLGGKALVTIRERSTLTITEEPNRTTVGLESGKIGLAVARDRMTPNESVQIRTSNAIAAVRGTVVVAEVERATAQAGAAASQVVSTFYVLRDPTNRGIEVTQIGGATTNLLPGQGFSILGAAPGRSIPIPLNVTAGLTTRAGAQHSSGSASATAGVAQTQTQQAVALANAVLGDPTAFTTPASESNLVAGGINNADTKGATTPPGPGISTSTAADATADEIGEILEVPPAPAPLLPGISGVVVADNLLVVNSADTLNAPGQLVIVSNADVTLSEPAVQISGAVGSTEPIDRPFVDIDATTVTAPGALRIFAGGSLNLTSPLVRASNTVFNFVSGDPLFDDVIRISATDPSPANASLTATTTSALVIINNSTANVPNGHFVFLQGGSSGGPTASMSLNGPLILATDSEITLSSATLEFVHLQNTSSLISTGTGGLMQFSGTSPGLSTVDLGTDMFETDALASVQLAGGLLDASLTSINISNGSVLNMTGGTFHSTAGNLVTLSAGSELTASHIANISTGANLNLAGGIFSSSNSTTTINGFAAISLSDGATATVGSHAVSLVDSALVASGSVIDVNNATLNAPSTAALVFVDSSTVNAARLLSIGNDGAVNFGGSLLEAVGSSNLNFSGDAITVSNTTLNSPSGTPLVVLQGSNLTLATRLLDVNSAGTATLGGPALLIGTGATLNFPGGGQVVRVADAGSVLNATGGAPLVQATAGNLNLGTASALLVDLGGTANVSGPVLSADGTTITSSGVFVTVHDGTLNATGTSIVNFANIAGNPVLGHALIIDPAGTVTSAGPVVRTTASTLSFNLDPAVVVHGGTLTAAGLLSQDGGTITAGSPGTPVSLLGLFSGGTANVTGGQPAVTVTNGTLNVFGALVSGDDAGNTLTLSGPGLVATNSTLNLGAFVAVGEDDDVIPTGAVALLQLNNSTMTVTAGNIFEVDPGTPAVFPGQAAILGGSTLQINGVFLETGNLTLTTAVPFVQVLAGSLIHQNTAGQQFIVLGDATAFSSPTGSLLQVDSSAVTGFATLVETNGTVNSAGAGSLVAINAVTAPVATTGDTFLVQGTLALNGGLLTATNSTLTAGNDFLQVSSSGALTSTTANALVTLNTSPITANNDIFRVEGTLTPHGGLLAATSSPLTAGGDFLGVLNGGSLNSPTAGTTLVTSTSSTYDIGGSTPNRNFLLLSGLGASATFNGPLVNSTSDVFNVTAAFVKLNGGAVSSPVRINHTNGADPNPFMSFNGSVLNLGTGGGNSGNVVELNSDTGLRYQGPQPLLQALTGGTAAWTVDRLLFSQTATPSSDPTRGLNSTSTSPLFSFSGAPVGTHTFRDSFFDLRGFNTLIEGDVDAAGLIVGSDEPLRHAGDLLRATGTAATPMLLQVGNASAGNGIKIDTALLAATAPLIHLILASASTPSDLLRLVQNAKLNGALVPADALVKLDAGTLTIANGVLANLNNASFMNLINTTLLSVTNNSTVSINANLNNFNAGALVRVAGGSVFKVTGGSLISFGAGTNSVTLTNLSNFGACGVTCSVQNVSFNGSGGLILPVLLKNGATAAQVQVAPGFNPFPGLGGSNTLTFSGNSSALFIVDGPASKVVLRP